MAIPFMFNLIHQTAQQTNKQANYTPKKTTTKNKQTSSGVDGESLVEEGVSTESLCKVLLSHKESSPDIET